MAKNKLFILIWSGMCFCSKLAVVSYMVWIPMNEHTVPSLPCSIPEVWVRQVKNTSDRFPYTTWKGQLAFGLIIFWPHIIIRRFICNIHATTTIHLHICPSYSWLILERFFIWHNFFNTLQTTPLIWIAHTSGVNSSNAKCYQRILQKIVKITRFFLSRMLLTKHEYSSAAKCCLANPAAAAS